MRPAACCGTAGRQQRYYDEIGLLRPARVGANGYRYYERNQLLRLQQILLLRDLGLDLATSAAWSTLNTIRSKRFAEVSHPD